MCRRCNQRERASQEATLGTAVLWCMSKPCVPPGGAGHGQGKLDSAPMWTRNPSKRVVAEQRCAGHDSCGHVGHVQGCFTGCCRRKPSVVLFQRRDNCCNLLPSRDVVSWIAPIAGFFLQIRLLNLMFCEGLFTCALLVVNAMCSAVVIA